MLNIDYLFEEDSFAGVVIALDKKLNVIRASGNFLKLQGYKESDLYNKPFINIIVPDDKSVFFDLAYAIENSKEFTIQCYHKHGAFRYFSFNMINLKDYKILFGKAIKKDFNSYEYVNESLNYLEKAYDKLDVSDLSEIIVREDKNMAMFLSVFPIDIWIKDRFNRYIFVNEAYTVHTGHTLDDVYLRDDFQLFPKDIAQGFTKSDQEAIEKGKRISYTFYSSINKLLTWTEVTKIPLYNINKQYIGILGFSNDVSESRQIEDKLNNIIDKYEYTLDEIDVLVVELNLKGTVVFTGGKLNKKLGLPKEEILKKNIFDMHNDNVTVKTKIEEAYNGKKTTVHVSMLNNKLEVVLHPQFVKNEVSSVIAIATLIGDDIDE